MKLTKIIPLGRARFQRFGISLCDETKNNFIIKLTTYCSMVRSYQTDNFSDQTIQNVQRY